ncbi:Small ubiquitin-related modifier 1 [Sesamum angolense]|uniref:Small ubiquitin-related modifier 1 n=2 Tax=Sesamum TaxID=4181 RepID=A0AAE2BIV4_9LAMI|nr:Small ubiquitin-related modifier 1 [Sesamum angolense]
MSSVEDDKKPADSSAHINLKVKGQVSSLFFPISFPPQSVSWFFFCVSLLLQDFPVPALIWLVSPFDFGGPFVYDEDARTWPCEDGNEVFFRIKRSTQLKKLMNAYCDRQSVDFNSIAFLFDGRRLRGEQTPDELEMEDGDEIDAMLHQTGGATA